MRILFCTTDGWNAFNGINAWLVRFLPALREQGHDVRALLFAWSPAEQCTTLPLLKNAGVPVDIVSLPRSTESAVRACLIHARRFQPEIFVANMVTPALYASGWLRAAGIPTIGILHNDDDEYRAKIELFGHGAEFLRVSAFVAISRGLFKFAERAGAQLILRCIPYGQPLNPRRAVWKDGAPLRLVYHGRIVQQQKRISETVDACVRVCRMAPGRLEADFYGSGPDEAAVKKILEHDDAGGRARFCGRLESTRVATILPDYQIGVLLSDYEGLGLSVLECMAAGLVPVCHRTTSGLPDMIESGRNGIFVDDRDSAFDRAILGLLAKPAEWQRLAEAAYATAAKDFSPAASVAAWEELFATLAPRRQSQHRLRVPIPWRVSLPAVHPALRAEDMRYPGLVRAVWRRLRFPRRA